MSLLRRRERPKKDKTPTGQLVELVGIVVIALVLALGIQAFLVKPYRIPSESMVPTLTVGQRVLVNRLGNNFSDPEVGDVLVFHPPAPANNEAPGLGPNGQCGVEHDPDTPCPKAFSEKADVNFIKRVVAGPGDRVAIVDGHVVRNGRRQAERFIRECEEGADCDFPQEIRVPADHWFMMGDNRGASDDSRYWGPVPEEWIIGGAFATYWPPKRVGLL